MAQPRRFPPPWSVDDPELGQECFIVRDANGQALAYVYFEDEPRRRSAAKLLTKDEAQPIAANSALPLRTATTPRGTVDPFLPTRTFSRNGGSKDAQMV
jgi:hypothetical protein